MPIYKKPRSHRQRLRYKKRRSHGKTHGGDQSLKEKERAMRKALEECDQERNIQKRLDLILFARKIQNEIISIMCSKYLSS